MTRLKKSTGIVLVFVVIVGSGLSQDQKDAGKVLERVAATYKSLNSYHFKGTIVREIKSRGIETRVETPFVIAGIKPDKMRMEMSSAPMNIDILQISNGPTIWEYMLRQKEYTKKDVAEIGGDTDLYFRMWSAALGIALPQYEHIAGYRGQPKLLREESLDMDGHSLGCYVIQAEYNLLVTSYDSESSSKTFWIDKARYVVVKEVSVTRGRIGETGATFEREYTTTFSVAKVDELLPETLFLFTPPEGTKEVKKLGPLEKARTK